MSGQADWVTLTSTANVSDVSFGDVVLRRPHQGPARQLAAAPRGHGPGLTKRARQWLRERGLRIPPSWPLAPMPHLTPAPPVGGPRLWWLARDRSPSDAKAHELEAAGPAVTAYGHGKWARARQRSQGGSTRRGTEVDRRGASTTGKLHRRLGDRPCSRAARTRPNRRHRSVALREPGLAAAVARGLRAGRFRCGRLAACRARALVVGIDRYGDPSVPAPSGARADAESFAATLARCGVVAADDIVLLLDADATRDRILAEFGALAEHGADQLAVFHFAGVGSWAASGPTLLTADAGTHPGRARAPGSRWPSSQPVRRTRRISSRSSTQAARLRPRRPEPPMAASPRRSRARAPPTRPRSTTPTVCSPRPATIRSSGRSPCSRRPPDGPRTRPSSCRPHHTGLRADD